MESSTRTVLISVAGIVVALAIMVGVGIGIARRVKPEVEQFRRPTVEQVEDRTGDEGDARSEMSLDLSGFNSIRTEGGWTVNLTRADSFAVDVSGAERAIEHVNVFTRGDTLHLTVDPGVKSLAGNLRATVRMPDLERVQTLGGVNFEISGFSLDRLDLDVEGAANFNANDGRIDLLTIEGDGAANLDFSRVPVGDAEVDMDGASSLHILMAGGELTGVLRGLGEVTYSGEVLNEHIRIDGLGRVRRK